MHFNEKKAAPPLDSKKQSQIVYVNSDSLMENYEYIKEAKKEMEAHRQKSEADFNAKGEAFQNAVKAYQSRAQSMTPDQMQFTEKDLKEKEEALMQYKDELTKELAQKEQEMDEKLYTAIKDYLKRNVGGKNYNYVLGYSKGGGILFANDSLDITHSLLDGLNKEFLEKK